MSTALKLASANAPPSATLSDLTEEFLWILRHINDATDDDGGEISQEMEQRLAAVEAALPQKIDGYVSVIREIEACAEACSREAARLAARGSSWQARAAWLRGRVLAAMQALGLPKLKTPLNSVTVAKNGGKVPLELTRPPEDLPGDYVLVKTVVDANKDLIRAKLESGSEEEREEVGRFAKLGERGVHLRIS